MGKKDFEVWDDSALINALDDAITTYKIMHDVKLIDGVKDGSKDGGEAEEKKMADVDVERQLEIVASVAEASNSVTEASAVNGHQNVKLDLTNGTAEQEAFEGYTNEQPTADYNKLFTQYYDLQEKLLVTWDQLLQFGYSADRFPGELNQGPYANVSDVNVSGQYSTFAGVQGVESSHQEQATPNLACQSTAVCCCCPCASQCTPCPASVRKLCPDAVIELNPGKSTSLGESDVIKIAMGAAEKALSSVKIQSKQEGTLEPSTDNQGKNTEDEGCATDISTVLKAWFSAGLVTGKYLAEQSNTKKRSS